MANPKFSKEILDFFNQLEKNNDRDWFNEHKKEFKSNEAKAKEAYKYIYESLNNHDVVDNFKLFRIYRDVRFSKNKLPYKTHFGGSFHRKKPELRGGYYVHIQPNNESFIATGFWEPNKDDLLRIRREFEQDDNEIRGIVTDHKFKSVWGDFVGDELKTAPRDFDKTHPAIDLIRKKQYIFTKKYTDKAVVSDNFIDDVNASFKTVRPFFDYMSDVLTSNLNGESII
ncbi:TIGR02453 family protein [Flavobacteriales bacterium 33_180_T64]|nr:TIGR02453 family protein [Flavobacteriales bacterium 33_180_T64]